MQGGYSRQNSIDEVDANAVDSKKHNGNPVANTSPLIVPAVR